MCKKIKDSQKKRYKKEEDVDAILQVDEAWRAQDRHVSDLQEEKNNKNKATKTIRMKMPKWFNKVAKNKKAEAAELLKGATQTNGSLQGLFVAATGVSEEQATEYLTWYFEQGGCDSEEIMQRSRDLKTIIADEKAKLVDLEKELEKKIRVIGNYVHESVPVEIDEKFNGHAGEWGTENRRINDGSLRHHHELLWMIGGYEPTRGVSVASHRAYFLTGPAVRLNLALQQYGLDFLRNYNYKEVYPPFFMNKSIMAKTAQLEEFDEALYHVTGGDEGEENEKYLIATSEQPISAMHQGEWIEEKDLPIRYAGISTCFRKEAGSHGKDAWGIFRVHQFEKIEQFVITNPEESWEMMDKMKGCAEEFYQSLNIPYEVVNIVSGELNNAAAKKYDLEGWFPTLGVYRELVSCSNCTDYQSRAMETRYLGAKVDDGKKHYVHMLNATLCATSRVICCILENYQDEDGIHVPPILRNYMGGLEFIPFVRCPPSADRPKKKKGKPQQKGKKKNKQKKKEQN